jgi:hypothetical protein
LTSRAHVIEKKLAMVWSKRDKDTYSYLGDSFPLYLNALKENLIVIH